MTVGMPILTGVAAAASRRNGGAASTAAAVPVRSTARRVICICFIGSSLENLLPGDHLAAVDLDHLAGDVGAVLAGEKGGHAGDFLRLGDALERNGVDHLRGRRLAPAGES